MKIYAALYNPMIYESTWGTISLHKTRKGAEMAMEFHKESIRKEWEKIYKTKEDRERHKFGDFESWEVSEYEVLD